MAGCHIVNIITSICGFPAIVHSSIYSTTLYCIPQWPCTSSSLTDITHVRIINIIVIIINILSREYLMCGLNYNDLYLMETRTNINGLNRFAVYLYYLMDSPSKTGK